MLGASLGFATMGTTLYSLSSAASQDRSTYSIVAVDPVTGDVGAAGASCVPISAAFLAALVPGQGAGAIQAAGIQENQVKVLELLREGTPANEIIRLMSDDTFDSEVEIRQYGVVTLHEGNIQAAGFTGEGNSDWAGDRQNLNYALSRARKHSGERGGRFRHPDHLLGSRYWSC